MRSLERNKQTIYYSLKASDIVDDAGTVDEALLCIFMLLYAVEHSYKVEKMPDMIETNYFRMANFMITREEKI